MNRGVRWTWLDQVRDHVRDGKLTNEASHVALLLAVHYINGSEEAWPSQAELAAAGGRSRRSVWTGLHELEAAGLLDIRRGHPAHTSGNVYRLRISQNVRDPGAVRA